MPEQLRAEHLIFVQIKLTSWVSKRYCIYGWFGDRIPVGDEIFRTRPDRSWDPPNLLYNEHRLSLPGVQRPCKAISRCFNVVPNGVGSKVLWNVGIRVPDHTAAIFIITVVQQMVNCHNSSYNLVLILWRNSFKTLSVDSLSCNVLMCLPQAALWPCDKPRGRSSKWKFRIALWSITVLVLALSVFAAYLVSFPLSFKLSLRRSGFYKSVWELQ
jgi:hypothetical protein